MSIARSAPPNLPILRPDQTLYSWCGEVHLCNGNPTSVDTSAQLFGSPRAGFFHDFPSHLDELAQRCGDAVGDSRTLALKHTLLGYYLPFVTPRRAEEILHGVRRGTVARLKFHLALPKSGIGAAHSLKGCDECFAADEAAGAHAYWRIHHQWPSVLMCRMHGRPLLFAQDSHTPIHRREWLLPRSGRDLNWVSLPNPSHAAQVVLLRLAEISEALASQQPATLTQDRLQRVYRDALRQCNLCVDRDNFDEDGVEEWLSGKFEPLLPLPTMEFLRRRKWWRHGPNSPGLHPMKHALLIHALFEDWHHFMAAMNASHAADAFASEILPSKIAGDPRLAVFSQFVGDGLSVSAAARRMGYSTGTGVRWAKLLGIQYTPRAKSLGQADFVRLRRLLAEGRAKLEVSAATGVSVFSIDRLLTSEPATQVAWHAARAEKTRSEYRRRLLELLRQKPQPSVSEIRAQPGNGFHWLYRNDRQWLEEHLPAIKQHSQTRN